MLKKRFKMKFLAFTVASMMAVTPVTTFAEGTKEVCAEDEDKKTVIGDVSVTGDYEDAVDVRADGYDAEVTTGSLDSKCCDGLYSLAANNAKVSVVVNGDINAGIDGVALNTLWGSEQEINVNGNITADENGIYVQTSDCSDDVMDADESEKMGDSKTTIRVNGDIESDMVGVDASAYAGGENCIEVAGDIKINGAEEEESRSAVNSWALGKYSRNDIAVEGNVLGDEIGVYLYTDGVDAENNIVIDGTVSEVDAAFLIDNGDTAGNNSITVWKVETKEYTVANWKVNEMTDKLEMVEDKEAEKKVQYIIKTKPTENATLTVTDNNGQALATVAGVGGKILEFAYEGDKVLLKIDVKDGYIIDAAYGDENQRLELLKDENGNYYTMIPKNGGVIFSVKLSKAVQEKEKKGEDIGVKQDKKVEEHTANAEVTPSAEDTANAEAAPRAEDTANAEVTPRAEDTANAEATTNAEVAANEYTSATAAISPNKLELADTTGLPIGTYAVKVEQGALTKAVLRAAVPSGYVEGFTFELITNGRADYTLKAGTITLVIPKELQKEGRTFAVIGLDKNGKTYVLTDTDTDPTTITFDVNIEGYVFDLIYKD